MKLLKSLQILHVGIVVVSLFSFAVVLVGWQGWFEGCMAFLVLSYTANAWLGPKSVCYLTYLEGQMKNEPEIDHFSTRLFSGDLFKEWKKGK
jgi:hypothetical protein